MNKKQKLELTWIGKEKRPRLSNGQHNAGVSSPMNTLSKVAENTGITYLFRMTKYYQTFR